MRIIFIYIFTSFSFICFGSFPTQNNIPLDTIKEFKKETLEEYRNRIKKQLYSNDHDLFQESINQHKSQKKEKKNLSKWQKTHPLLRVLYIILGLIIVLIIYFGVINPISLSPSISLSDLESAIE